MKPLHVSCLYLKLCNEWLSLFAIVRAHCCGMLYLVLLNRYGECYIREVAFPHFHGTNGVAIHSIYNL